MHHRRVSVSNRALHLNQATGQSMQDVLAINNDVGLVAVQFWRAEQ
jgi:hypothetical protein